jgi:hypothetical protein
MLTLRKVVELEKESFTENLYYKWIITFNLLDSSLIMIINWVKL